MKARQLGPMHVFGISALTCQMSKEVFQVEHGSLYPAPARLEDKVLIESERDLSDNNREVKALQTRSTWTSHWRMSGSNCSGFQREKYSTQNNVILLYP